MRSYVVSCSSDFRGAAADAAARLGVGISDLATFGLLLYPGDRLLAFADPGDAPRGDREDVVLRSGERAGRALRRKPRLQVRLRSGLTPGTIRRAVAAAIQTLDPTASADTGPVDGSAPTGTPPTAPEPGAASAPGPLEPSPPEPSPSEPIAPEPIAPGRALDEPSDAPTGGDLPGSCVDPAALMVDLAAAERRAEEAEHGLQRAERTVEDLRTLVGLLAFDHQEPVTTEDQARYVLGFPPDAALTRQRVKARFRLLTQVYHPDRATGDSRRMAQVIEATRLLERQVRDRDDRAA